MRHQGSGIVLLLVSVLAAATAGCGPSTASSSAANNVPAAPQFLLNQGIQADGKTFQVTVDRESYPPHYAGLWHTHPGPGSFCVLQGQLTIEAMNQQPLTLAPGQCWAEPPGVAHRPTNNTDQVAEALFYLLAPAGEQRIQSAAPPANP